MLLTSVCCCCGAFSQSLHLPLPLFPTDLVVSRVAFWPPILPCPPASKTTTVSASSSASVPLASHYAPLSADRARRVLHRQCLYYCSCKRAFCQLETLVSTLTIASRAPSRYSRLPPDHDPTEPRTVVSLFCNNFAAVTSIECWCPTTIHRLFVRVFSVSTRPLIEPMCDLQTVLQHSNAIFGVLRAILLLSSLETRAKVSRSALIY